MRIVNSFFHFFTIGLALFITFDSINKGQPVNHWTIICGIWCLSSYVWMSTSYGYKNLLEGNR